MREALDAAGRGDVKLQVTTGLPTVKDAGGALDLARTMDGVAPLVEAGITDFRVRGPGRSVSRTRSAERARHRLPRHGRTAVSEPTAERFRKAASGARAARRAAPRAGKP